MRGVRHGSGHTGRSALIILFLLAVIGGGLFGVYVMEKREDARAADAAEADDPDVRKRLKIYYIDQLYELRDDLETILIMGLDKYDEPGPGSGTTGNGRRADLLLLMVVNDAAKQCSVIHIDRNAMAEIRKPGQNGAEPGTFTGQLALAYTFGSGGKDSCRRTAEAVSDYLRGVPVDHYAAMPMESVSVLNDLAGGVEVHTDRDYSFIDPTLIQGKNIRLRGEQALSFIRSFRQNGKADLSCTARQRIYSSALYEQLREKLRSDDRFGAALAWKLFGDVKSDLSAKKLSELADHLKEYVFTGIDVIEGEAKTDGETIEFRTDEEALRQLVIGTFFKPVGEN